MTRQTKRRLILTTLLCGWAMAIAATVQAEADMPVKRPVEAYVDPNVQTPVDVYDPLEGFNRGVYKFNTLFDRYVFLHVVRGYEFVTPKLVRRGITNFFSNLTEPRNFLNSLLQGKAEGCVHAVMRFALNSTIGLGGLLDPATPAGYHQRNEDFGQTLGVWGLGPGPFLVIPIVGPSDFRDTGGFILDTTLYSLWTGEVIDGLTDSDGTQNAIAYGLMTLNAINTRSNVKFRYYETGSPFEYELVRFLYLKKRELEIDH